MKLTPETKHLYRALLKRLDTLPVNMTMDKYKRLVKRLKGEVKERLRVRPRQPPA